MMGKPPVAVLAAAQAPEMPVALFAGVFAVSVLLVGAFAVASGWIAKGLTAPQPDETDELEPVVGGIREGAAGVPRWLYAAYVIIPLWAVFYLVNNVDVRTETVPEPGATATAPAGGTAGTPAPPTPSTEVEIVAENLKFDKASFAFVANTQTTIVVSNEDRGVQHNVAIYADETATHSLFVGALFPGIATREYTVPPIAAGTYFFKCDVHPTTMKGSVTVA